MATPRAQINIGAPEHGSGFRCPPTLPRRVATSCRAIWRHSSACSTGGACGL